MRRVPDSWNEEPDKELNINMNSYSGIWMSAPFQINLHFLPSTKKIVAFNIAM